LLTGGRETLPYDLALELVFEQPYAALVAEARRTDAGQPRQVVRGSPGGIRQSIHAARLRSPAEERRNEGLALQRAPSLNCRAAI
jgi:hypothetical protein